MLLSDRLTGFLVSALGAATAYGGSRLPPVPGQPVGPSAFPVVIGVALVACGLLIAAGVGRRFEEAAEADLAAVSGAPDASSTGAPGRSALFALLPPLLLAFYALVVEVLGFVPTAAIIVGATALAFRGSARLAAGLALVAPPLVHLVFYKVLRVPLPAGLLPMPW